MIITDPPDVNDKPVVLAFSDAATDIQAVREISDWARGHGFVRSREYPLNVREKPDGSRIFYSACYRLNSEDKRAIDADLRRIDERRNAMPLTAPSSQLVDDYT